MALFAFASESRMRPVKKKLMSAFLILVLVFVSLSSFVACKSFVAFWHDFWYWYFNDRIASRTGGIFKGRSDVGVRHKVVNNSSETVRVPDATGGTLYIPAGRSANVQLNNAASAGNVNSASAGSGNVQSRQSGTTITFADQ
jgi:hypothetical protein